MPTIVTKKIEGSINSSEMKVCNNLVYNRYSLYLNRQEYEKEIERFVFSDVSDMPIMFVFGKGGSGKSAVVYNFLNKIIKNNNYTNQLDKVFWFSDADKPGQLDLKYFIDEIKFYSDASLSSSKVLLSIDDEIRSINKCFDPSKTSIIVLDNFETIKDNALIEYVFQKLPPSCKLIIISKNKSHYYIEKSVVNSRVENAITEIEIASFSIEEWKTIFDMQTRGNSLYQDWVRNVEKSELESILKLVYETLGGNIFGMLLAMSHIIKGNYNNCSLANEILCNNVFNKDVFDRIVSKNWDTIKEESKRLLIAAALKGDPVIDLKLAAAFSDLGKLENGRPCLGSELQKAIEECCDMSLINRSFENEAILYSFDPIVFRFLNGKIEKDDCDKKVINRWINHYVEFSESIGFCFDDITKLRKIDNPTTKNSLFKVIDYCYDHKRTKEFISMTKNLRYYFYTRMIWTTGEDCIHMKRANAAQELGDHIEELEALSYYINIASKYKQFDKIDTYINRAREIIKHNKDSIPFNTIFRFTHTEALYYYSKGENNCAIEKWSSILNDERINEADVHDVDAATRWQLKCLLENDRYDSNERLSQCESLIRVAKEHSFTRAVIDLSLIITEEYIKLNKQTEGKAYLEAIQEMVAEANDSIYTAKYYYCKSIVLGRTEDGVENLFKARELKRIINNDLLFEWYEEIISKLCIFNLKICFVRHLPTKNNLEDVFVGRLDHECDTRFIKEHKNDINNIKEKIAEGKYDLVYVSPLKRALKTAELYAPDSKIIKDERLIERDLGNWSNVAKAKLRKTTPEAFFPNGRMNFRFTPPNGESYESLIRRVLGFVLEVYCNCNSEKILVITHNGVITVIKCLINEDFNTEGLSFQDHLELLPTTINEETIKQIKKHLNSESILNL